MKSPSQIAEEAIQDELYARELFARIITLPAAEFRAAVENDPRACTEFMARHIFDHMDQHYPSIPAEHALVLTIAASVAARQGEPHVRFRAAKELANGYRYLGRFDEAKAALRCAEELIEQTLALAIHRATTSFARLALSDCWGDSLENSEKLAAEAIRRFEAIGAFDRAYSVRLYDAYVKSRHGQYLAAVSAFLDASHRARDAGSKSDLATNYYNLGHCYRNLNDFATARNYFAEAALIFRSQGSIATEGHALRCVGRMAIRMNGDPASAMGQAKSAFFTAGMAGEICRCTLAVMEESVRMGEKAGLVRYCLQLESEAVELGVSSLLADAIKTLREAVHSGSITEELLAKVWDMFAPHYGANFSAIEAVHN